MIVVRLSGGMGNQMFQYAFGRALSLKHNVPLALDVTYLNHRVKVPHFLRPHFVFRNFDLDVFNIQAGFAKSEEISFWNKPFSSGKIMVIIDAILRKLAFLPGWEKKFTFDERALSFGQDTYLEGYWQSEKYFKNIADILRKDFSLKKPLSERSQILMDEIKSTESVCLHIRRGDYATNSFNVKHGEEYHTKAIEYILKHRKIEKIYIFSNDTKWCEENLKFSIPSMVVGDEYAGVKAEEHFALMSSCKHFITANSTFSWWAAWLSNNPDKIVVTPSKWFNDESIDIRDLIPTEWVKI